MAKRNTSGKRETTILTASFGRLKAIILTAVTGKHRIIIPIAAAIVVLAVFAGLMLFTDVFKPGEHNSSGDGSIVDSSGQPGEENPQATPAPPSGNDEPGSSLSGEGGVVRVTGHMEFEFSPSISGGWEIWTSDNGDSDPLVFLSDSYGDVLLYDDNSGEDLNAYIFVYLEEGETYLIEVRTYLDYSDGELGSCTLHVAPETAPVVDAPPISAGSVRVTGESWFTFTPDQSGVWEFRTSERGDSDPYLEILDDNENNVAYDDNSGAGLNAFISASLKAGTPYTIKVNFYSEDEQSCTLTISQGTG